MCGRLSQYRGIHDFVAALSIPHALLNYVGDQPFERYNARVEKVAHGPFFRAIWPHRAIIAIDNWFEWVDEGGPKKQPYLIRRKDRAPILCAAIGQYPNGEHEPGEHDGFVIITVTAPAAWWTSTNAAR